jgi:hypothetical protein
VVGKDLKGVSGVMLLRFIEVADGMFPWLAETKATSLLIF